MSKVSFVKAPRRGTRSDAWHSLIVSCFFPVVTNKNDDISRIASDGGSSTSYELPNSDQMSVDVNWEALTGGDDGAALAETIRQFVHERFQSISLPNLIRSVSVHAFEFGKIAPEITLKDIGDPLPDFYESEGEDSVDDPVDAATTADSVPEHHPTSTRHPSDADGSRRRSQLNILHPSGTHNLTQGTTPGILGHTSNLGYFHLPLSAGLPGTHTPLAAVAGAHFQHGQMPPHGAHHHADSPSSVSPSSTATPVSSQDHAYFSQRPGSAVADDLDMPSNSLQHDHPERSPDDLQVVFHATYAGDVKLSLTADVFLDYPMPSFVGIPLKLKITGLTFNGVGILACIKKRANLCFLGPEDAEALVGGEPILDPLDAKTEHESSHDMHSGKVGALLEAIKIESEMGETESGKQVLKNVGKIEKFILEQVQRIFEDEFVYPSFWTFLV
ncbi:uncharacterized protein MYCFIDRAFT_164040 [Pseudocercospora fijiensis CIRAD86]|uniref:Mitochondrial distribution and morphology protein 12 n=1 Tax=Pseudocercospora fijiensis (strain CIRAD86) TaxID=383855 RepID=M3AZR5_PSEFD|nr:uncharacterized protein MYCFIDRAFT_164040 [Pseudocercospora fijiensis CIRAD86]EME82677.1 hypothetical protein MYCFIDRAFT_164040 [Pseudocercospora fijiensis CIRAD86]